MNICLRHPLFFELNYVFDDIRVIIQTRERRMRVAMRVRNLDPCEHECVCQRLCAYLPSILTCHSEYCQ